MKFKTIFFGVPAGSSMLIAFATAFCPSLRLFRSRRSKVRRAFGQGFGEDVAVAGGQGDAAEGGEGWGDVGGRDGLEILAGLDAEAHQQDGDVLIVVVGDPVTGRVGALLSG